MFRVTRSNIRSNILNIQTRQKHYILNYKYVEGILEKRGPYREQHLGNAKELAQQGKLLLAGAHGDAGGATFIFDCENESIIKNFVTNDPYVLNGLVTDHEIKEWMTVNLK